MQPSASGSVSCRSTSKRPRPAVAHKSFCREKILPKSFWVQGPARRVPKRPTWWLILLLQLKAAPVALVHTLVSLFKEFPDSDFCFSILGTSF